MQGAMQANMKMMQYFMPIMLGVFAVLYSTAFTIYMVVSNIFTTVFQLIYNIVAKKHDKDAEDARLSSTFK
jgi:60Kd inner membrane protein.